MAQRCWVAVSGNHAGSHPIRSPTVTMVGDQEVRTAQYQFPGTISGRPVSHGEIFDDVGGTYLAARDEPYVEGQGGREIDDAIAYTFDSIVVAPGMRAELRNSNGTVLFKGDGPVVVESTNFAALNDYYAGLKARKDLPQWMITYVSGIAALPTADLHPVQWVKVSVISGGSCDTK